jgi:XTP/dITP diphosphohydrolase
VRILFASSNPHKVKEVRAILGECGVEVLGLDDLNRALPEPIEDGATFADNARIKAVYYARAAGRFCLADDSGLEVEALRGAPGVHSARYAGAEGGREQRDRANNARLLRELAAVPQARRGARFVCAMCLAEPHGNVVAETRGEVEGRIGFEPRGVNGFGYDPLFLLPELGRSSAELSPRDKNLLSHRGRAGRAMAQRLREIALI